MTLNIDKKAPKAKIKAACSADAILIKMIGLSDMNAAVVLYDFIERCMSDIFKRVIIDLTECTGMDSTFMGTILSLSTLLKRKPASLVVCNVCADNKALFKMLGVDLIINICDDVQIPELELISMPSIIANPKKRIKLIKKAHKLLIAADNSNRERFGSFMAALDLEMGE